MMLSPCRTLVFPTWHRLSETGTVVVVDVVVVVVVTTEKDPPVRFAMYEL